MKETFLSPDGQQCQTRSQRRKGSWPRARERAIGLRARTGKGVCSLDFISGHKATNYPTRIKQHFFFLFCFHNHLSSLFLKLISFPFSWKPNRALGPLCLSPFSIVSFYFKFRIQVVVSMSITQCYLCYLKTNKKGPQTINIV